MSQLLARVLSNLLQEGNNMSNPNPSQSGKGKHKENGGSKNALVAS